MKQIIASLLIVLLATTAIVSQAQAQVVEPGPRHLRAWQKGMEAGEELYGRAVMRRPVPYTHVREADVMWAKRVWEEIDLREKINHPLYYPTQPTRHRKSLMQTLWDAATGEGEMELIVYKDEDFKNPYQPEELDALFSDKDTITMPNPLDPDYDTTIYVDNPFDPADVMHYRMIEDWFFDRERSVLEKRVIGLGPIRERYTTDPTTGERIFQGKEVMFWVYYPHARDILVRTEVFNRFNDAERMTFDDVFFKRMFNARIVKVDNVYDRWISEYADGLDALLEADKIKNTLHEYEMDLWEY